MRTTCVGDTEWDDLSRQTPCAPAPGRFACPAAPQRSPASWSPVQSRAWSQAQMCAPAGRRPMARPDKAAAVAEIVDSFNDSTGAVLTEYRGLTVKQLQDLRRALGENANYAVVKNTLTKIAAKQAGVDGV